MAARRHGLAGRRKAVGLSQEALAYHLGVERSTVVRWEAGATDPLPWLRPKLAVALAVSREELHRLLTADSQGGTPALLLPDDDRFDTFAWEDDLDYAFALFSRQALSEAKPRIERWLLRADTPTTDRSLALEARSRYLFGNILRDEGVLLGPGSAMTEYRRAQELYRALGQDRRVGQLDLLLGVISEMRLDYRHALRVYRDSYRDGRLSAVDRARALLWQGTVLTKQHCAGRAVGLIQNAIRDFERSEAALDWEAAHQKLALAYVHSAKLDLAVQAFDVPLSSTLRRTPLQEVQLTVARAHLLVTAAQTDEAAQLLDSGERLASDHHLHHQLSAVRNLRTTIEQK